MTISRRVMFRGLGAGLLSVPVIAAAEQLRPTPQETLGPFFPVRVPAQHHFDLTRVSASGGRAKGQVIELSGQVLGVDGSPVPDATIEIWQANAAGRYINPNDTNPAPLDPNFRGVAVLRSNGSGHYRIRTIKPGAYPAPQQGMRTPHIHFDVTARDYRLVTQMYFPGEALNETDVLMSTMPARHRDPALTTCTSIETREPGVLAFQWDIVLLRG